MGRLAAGGQLMALRQTSGAMDEAALGQGLTAHLSRVTGRSVSVGALHRRSAGFSWITYSFSAHDGSSERVLILRIAPPNGLFAPYTVYSQVHALEAFAGSEVPVPALVSHAQDGAQLGHPFFISTWVRGDVPAPWTSSAMPEQRRRAIAGQFIDILAGIHRLDWAGSPLAALHAGEVPPELRAVRTWREALARRTTRFYPLLEWGGRWLETHCPRASRITVVHGDYRIGNFLEEAGQITAILDWELTHLGDPHEDLAWALMPTFNGGSRKFYGVVEREAFLDRYQGSAGAAIDARTLAYYEAFALYQAAAIQMRAVQAFDLDGYNDMRMAVMSTQMPSIVRAFDRALERAA